MRAKHLSGKRMSIITASLLVVKLALHILLIAATKGHVLRLRPCKFDFGVPILHNSWCTCVCCGSQHNVTDAYHLRRYAIQTKHANVTHDFKLHLSQAARLHFTGTPV